MAKVTKIHKPCVPINQSFRTIARTCGLIWGLIFVLVLAGCEGDTGDVGPAGPPGPSGPPGSFNQVPEELQIRITDVSINSAPVIKFEATDQFGFPFDQLTQGQPSFTIAKLVPGTGGDSDHWQSYLNQIEAAGVGPGTEDAVQARTENDGTLVNNGDGTYEYTFATDLDSVTEPVSVPFEPDLTHRVGLEIRGSFLGESLPLTNAVFTFQPSSGLTDNIPQRKIVAQASCNSCHGELRMHGDGRQDVDLCVTCHNPGSTDANSGNSLDFRVLTHKIHMGEQLPSVESGGEYVIYGFRDSRHDFSDVAFPQSPQTCVKCHDPASSETPDASNIVMRPTIESCGSCHDDVDFSAGEAGGHPGGIVTDNSECSVCHAENKIAGSVLESHAIPAQVAASLFSYNILEVNNTMPGEFPSIKFSVTDPTKTNNDDELYYDLKNNPEFTSSESRLAVILAWDTGDYTNVGSGSAPAKVVSINALADSTANGDGTFTVVSPVAIPVDVEGSGAVGIEGHPAADPDDDGTYDVAVPVTGAVHYFPITDTQVQPRREVVELASCQNCHGENDGLSLHGSNRTDNVQLCVMCHNPRATDIAQRPADNSEETAIDFKRLIHGIHGADKRTDDLIVFGFGSTPHDFSEVRYPRDSGDCVACHADGTFELPLPTGVLATTVDTGTDVSSQNDDQVITATASVCSACHDDDTTQTHMEQNGASFGLLVEDTADLESCAVCHGPGSIADVRAAHNLSD
ncbi:OmcA/MtrC family decaheme c-type cytochrome [Marinobacter orientalis]|uniref:OmcA/MtrC family decaheme c-type cytochrome n=1 Tax=Marinobacter orientalis TaxID=1928859 RepID=A0A7Y0NIV5_9GAMM|nr:OmcA/MtrC family decaheme c-type cytochrome [Marinobacter orientalis]NMT62276.1 OmcA/MtrC family decaheme c-type cytochrome [Marinobacter orientalis]